MKRGFVILCCCIICVLMPSCLNQSPGFFVRVKDETNFIQTKDTLNSKYDSLAIIKPYVLVGNIKSFDFMLNFKENPFDIPITLNDYSESGQQENKFTDYCYYKYEKLFKNKITTYKVMLSDTDYAVLKAAVYILKKMFHSENIKDMQLTKEIRDVLAKYKGNYFLVTDMEEYYYDYHGSTGGVHDWKLIRLFVFDKKRQKIMYYNNSLHLDAAYHHDRYKTHLLFKGLGYALHKFKKNLHKTP